MHVVFMDISVSYQLLFPYADTVWIFKEGCFIDWSWSYGCWHWPQKWIGGNPTSYPTIQFLHLY